LFEVAIIGAGPAGASAAIFTSKAGLKTLLIDSGQSMTKRALLRNHYGIKDITGPQIIEIGKEQAVDFGAVLVESKVQEIFHADSYFHIQLENDSFDTKQIIIATGALTDLAKKIGLAIKPGIEPYIRSIIQVDASGKTHIPGIWAAGVAAGSSVHTIISSGDGARVAINLISEKLGRRYVDHPME